MMTFDEDDDDKDFCCDPMKPKPALLKLHFACFFIMNTIPMMMKMKMKTMMIMMKMLTMMVEIMLLKDDRCFCVCFAHDRYPPVYALL